MKTPKLKRSNSCFGLRQPFLTGAIRNSELSPVASRYIALNKKNPLCKISVRLESGKAASAWGKKTLTYLFEKQGIVAGIKKVLAGYIKADETYSLGWLEGPERDFAKKQNLVPYFSIKCIIVDEFQRKVFILGDTLTDVFGEHGEAICYAKGRWMVGEFDFYDTVKEQPKETARKRLEQKWETVFPLVCKNAPVENDVSILYGVWRLNPTETVAAREQCGISQKELDEVKQSEQQFSFSEIDQYIYSRDEYDQPVGGATVKIAVACYKRRGNTFEIITKCGQWNHSVWCDGTRMSPFPFFVYTQVKKKRR